MAGISSKAAGHVDNKRHYNGIDHETDLDLNQYNAFYRNLDPQVGRWWQLDPKPNLSISMFTSMDDNPIKHFDFLGDTVLIRFKKIDIVYNNGILTNKDGSVYNGKIKGFLMDAVNALNSARTSSSEAANMIGELQGSSNNFTIVKGTDNKFNVNSTQLSSGYANQLRTDPSLALTFAVTPTAAMQGGAGGTITWDPSGANVWILGGGQNNNPTTNLMHELFHGRDANRGLLDTRLDNGLKRDEWQATYKENIVRQQMNLPLKEFYRSQDNGGIITPLAPRMLDTINNPVLPAWVPIGW